MRTSSGVTMSIVSTGQGQPHAGASEPGAMLEVVVLHVRDVEGAHEGGADRLYLVADVDSGGLSPEPQVVSSICRETDIPARVLLRLNQGLTTTGGELSRLVGLGED